MRSVRLVSIGLLAVAIAAGTLAERPRARPPLTIGGYRVLAADFHTHSSTWSDGALTPWGLVLEAERQGLDAIAITGHNQALTEQTLGRSLRRRSAEAFALRGWAEAFALRGWAEAIALRRTYDRADGSTVGPRSRPNRRRRHGG